MYKPILLMIMVGAFLSLAFISTYTGNARDFTYQPESRYPSDHIRYTLGNYPDSTVALGSNSTVTPTEVPVGAARIVVSTNSNFKGTFAANPATGVVRVTNAHPAGTYPVTVKSFGPGAATKTFTLTVSNGTACNGQVQFISAANVSVGSTPFSVAIGDFNNDGNQDLAAANRDSNTVSIRLGNGSGGFGGVSNVAVGFGPISVVVGDFSDDGNQDFATVNNFGNTVSVRLGNGLGSFTNFSNDPLGPSPAAMALADFNNDGNQDFAVSNSGTGTNANNVSVRLGDGVGIFFGNTEVGVAAAQIGIAIGDFNNDGNQDFAAALQSASAVAVRLGNGSGGFTSAANVSVGGSNFSVSVGDFDNNGIPDFLSTKPGSNNIAIRLGTGGGAFSAASDVAVGTVPIGSAIGDFNRDGNQDFVTANSSAGTLSIRFGSGLGGFTGSTEVTAGTGARAVAIGDFNGDGTQDLAAANANGGADSISIRLGACVVPPTLGNYPSTTVVAGSDATINPDAAPSSFTSINASATGNFAGVLAVDPVSGKVRITNANPTGVFLVTVRATNAGITVSRTFSLTVINGPLCAGQPLFTSGANVTTASRPRSVAVGDLNNDGNQDLAVANNLGQSVSIRLGNGLGAFASSGEIAVDVEPVDVAIADFNNDGNQDIAVANSGSNNVSIRLGNGSGSFSGSTNVAIGTSITSIAIGDFNNDGNKDFAVAAADSADAVLIRLGNGLGGFSGTTTLSVGDNPNDIVVGDFNNDGKQDFAVANFGLTDRSISVRLGDGLGGFGSATTVSVGGVPQGLAIGDLNNDGVQDIATANSGSDSVSIRLGNGTGGFGGTTEIGVSVAGGFPSSIIIADFNNDGNKDFATGNQLANTLSIRLGDGSGSFSSPLADLGVGVRPLNLAIGDFNKDGATDIATADIGSDFVSIRTGGCGAPTFSVVDGRVTTPDGRGLRNAVVSIIDSQSNRRTVTTSSFGVYSLANIATGQTYTLTVSSKRYRFSPKVLQINGDLSNLDFVGLE